MNQNTTGVATFGTIVGGSAYTNGTYNGVQLTYSSGTTAATYPTANIVVSGGVVTSVTLVTAGTGFKDTTTVMTATAASIGGGTGTGFTVAVATLRSGGSNSAFGYQALCYNTTGGYNTAVGYQAGYYYNGTTGNNTTPSNSVYIGNGTSALADGQTNQIVIGDSAIGAGSNTVTLGNTSIVTTILRGGVYSGSLGVGTAASGTTGEIRATNNITAYYSSDKRLKENIVPIADALLKLNSLTGVEFDWTQNYMETHGGEDGVFIRKHDVGVIAQQLQTVLPELVIQRNDGYLAVKYDRIVALLIEAIKELEQRVKDLEAK